MHRWFLLFPILLIAGCAGFFKVPQTEYRQKVQTLGVLPLLVDGNSVITHPDREAVMELLRRHSLNTHLRLIDILKEQKGYFDVRPVEGNPRELFRSLVISDALRGTGADIYRHYGFNSRIASELTEENVVDALLVIILHGEVRPAKRWDRRHLAYLEAPYNEILTTAAVVMPSGEVVWEYPGVTDGAFLFLQYPDFDEAFYNRSDEVRIRYISLAGLDRTLGEADRSLLGRRTLPGRYRELFESLAAALKPGLLNPFKEPPTAPADVSPTKER
jgi:hypothetical protein